MVNLMDFGHEKNLHLYITLANDSANFLSLEALKASHLQDG